jgi:hypothetical protein
VSWIGEHLAGAFLVDVRGVEQAQPQFRLATLRTRASITSSLTAPNCTASGRCA